MRDRWLENLGSIRSRIRRLKEPTLKRRDIERIFNVKKEAARQLIHLIHHSYGKNGTSENQLTVSVDAVKSLLNRFPAMPNNATPHFRRRLIEAARLELQGIKPARRTAPKLLDRTESRPESTPELPSQPNLVVPLGSEIIAAIVELASKKGVSPGNYAATILQRHTSRIATERGKRDEETTIYSKDADLFSEPEQR